jgi:hypothetical protein
MSVATRFRDALRAIVPWWLSDRPTPGAGPGPSNLNVGFRYLWSMIAPLDQGMEFLVEGVQAAWPELADPSALPYIGRTRGIVQGMTETDQHYATRLRQWFEAWAQGRTMGLAIQLHEYLANNPRVRIVDRRGDWVTVDTDGTITFAHQAWDWDSVSNPERAGFWSELWIIIYPQVWAQRPGTLGGLIGDDGYGIGHLAPHVNADQVRTIIATWKGAHSRIRAVLWTSDATKYDPGNPSSLPDGHWGQWSNEEAGNGSRVASHRDLVFTRYWEPN